MLTPEQIRRAPDELVKVYREIEDEVIAKLAKQLSKGDLTNTGEYLAEQLAYNTAADVSQALAVSRKKVDETAASTVMKYVGGGIAGEASFIGATLSPLMLDKLDRLARITSQRLLDSNASIIGGTTQAYNEIVTKATTAVASGVKTSQQALEDAVTELGSRGISQIRYDGRGTLQVEDAIRSTIRTEINQEAASASLELYAEAGQDLVEVSWHTGARPEHAEWQGGIFSLSGTSDKYPEFIEATGYGDAAGLCGVNCRHTFGAYDEDLGKRYPEPIDREENDRIYDLEQKQRYQERKIRELKREKIALDAAGLDASKVNAKIRERQANIRSLVDQSGMRRQSNRERILG